MNIKELIERLRLETTPSETTLDFAAEALLAQQVVIEQMLKKVSEVIEYERKPLCMCFAGCADCDPTKAPKLDDVLALQPDLAALREHDAEVILKPFAEQEVLYYADAVRYAERIRKGEV